VFLFIYIIVIVLFLTYVEHRQTENRQTRRDQKHTDKNVYNPLSTETVYVSVTWA